MLCTGYNNNLKMLNYLCVAATFIFLLTSASANTYFVTPTPNIPCPSNDGNVPCFSLSWYASNVLFASNTTLLLLPGNHYLTSDFLVRNVMSLAMLPAENMATLDAVINCDQSSKFYFVHVNVVSLSGLTLIGCANNVIFTVDQLIIAACSFHGQPHYGRGLYIDSVFNVSISKSNFTGFNNNGSGGALAVYNSGLTITSCTFINNSAATGAGALGGAILVFLVYEAVPRNISINNSTFLYNTATGISAHGGAVNIAWLAQQFSGNIIVENSMFINNTATGNSGDGGGMEIYVNTSTQDFSGSIGIKNTVFTNNTAIGSHSTSGGGLSLFYGVASVNFDEILGHISIESSMFVDNTAYSEATTASINGGAVFANFLLNTSSSALSSIPETLSNKSLLTIDNCNFIRNTVYGNGTGSYSSAGALGTFVVSQKSHLFVTINNSIFVQNACTARSSASIQAQGGALWENLIIYTEGGQPQNALILNSIFTNNSVNGYGGAVVSTNVSVTIQGSTFSNNSAVIGGAIAIFGNALKNFLTLKNVQCTENHAMESGGALYINSIKMNSCGFLNIHNNTAQRGVLYAEQSSLNLSGITTISNNCGSLYPFSSNVTFIGNTTITGNLNCFEVSQEGGAVTSFQSDLIFSGTTQLINNTGFRGGAFMAAQSRIFMYGVVTIAYNNARFSGGGIFAYQSEVFFDSRNTSLLGNQAVENGGGIYALSSIIRFRDASQTHFNRNNAIEGGGAYLKLNSKLYIVKSKVETQSLDSDTFIRLEFTENYAEKYGGALYIDDTNSDSCNAIPFSSELSVSGECFFQSFGLRSQQYYRYTSEPINTFNTYVRDNRAGLAGDAFYGGLLDRCSVNSAAEILKVNTAYSVSSTPASVYLSNTVRFLMDNSTQLLNNVSSSEPVRVCFCVNGQNDCSYQPPPMNVSSGQSFTVSLVAVNHFNVTIPDSLINAFVSTEAKLGEGQSVQRTNNYSTCTDMSFSVLSMQNKQQLHLYADGPCILSAGISKSTLNLNINLCPVGFDKSPETLHCVCDPFLIPDKYIYNCSIDEGSVLKHPEVWISYANDTGILRYPHCPFDYCQPFPVPINLGDTSDSNFHDVQCNFNRTGKLCGQCKDGLSLILGSSQCLDCSDTKYHVLAAFLFIIFAIFGFLLVVFLLVLNLTVSVGTINGLIFYANVIAANKQVFFQSNENSRILTVFISWINLDFGISTCFINGMNSLVKAGLQVLFPAYVIFLVIIIIVISRFSQKFARLLLNKNPVATLATLILLSLSKFLRTVIIMLSFTKIDAAETNSEMVWQFDGNVPYWSVGHIFILILAIIILVVGMLFSSLLFFWQWLLRCPDKKGLKWIRNTKLMALMDAYCAPYFHHHRFWTGLILFVRLFLYIMISVINDHISNSDPRVFLVILIFVTGSLIMYMAMFKVYKQWPVCVLELSFLLNLNFTSVLTLYFYQTSSERNNAHNIPGYVSISIALVTFLVIVTYHIYEHVRVVKKSVTRLRNKLSSKRSIKISNTSESKSSQAHAQTDSIVVSFDSLREPLLDDPTFVEETPFSDNKLNDLTATTYSVCDGPHAH